VSGAVGPSGAVVLGGYVNGLGLVRALGARGVPVAVVRTQPFDIAHRSRHVDGHARVEDVAERPETLAELLMDRARDWGGRVLLPTNDESLEALATHHDRLASHYRIESPPDAAGYLLDKRRMASAARAVGAELPHRYGPADAVTAEREDLRFPVLVKPLAGHRFAARFGAKVFEARDRGELRACVARLDGIEADVHDLVPGDDSHIYAHAIHIDARGEPTPGVTIRKLRGSPPRFGVARVAEIPARPPPGVHELTVELARRIGQRGPAVAEFKRDPRDETLRFIEVNGRPVVYNALLRRAGLDLAAIACAGAGARANGWRGVWVNLHADLLYALLRERLGVRELVAPYRRPKVEAVWSRDDPRPFMAQWAWTARRATQRA
jgi:D-aspartate ligase